MGLTAWNSQDVTWHPRRGAFCSGFHWFSGVGGRPAGLSRSPAGDHSREAPGESQGCSESMNEKWMYVGVGKS